MGRKATQDIYPGEKREVMFLRCVFILQDKRGNDTNPRLYSAVANKPFSIAKEEDLGPLFQGEVPSYPCSLEIPAPESSKYSGRLFQGIPNAMISEATGGSAGGFMCNPCKIEKVDHIKFEIVAENFQDTKRREVKHSRLKEKARERIEEVEKKDET